MNYTTRNEKHLKIAILATAFVVFWIYLGSIINFHQHHIFGRTLMTQGILCKREETIQASVDMPVYLVQHNSVGDITEMILPAPTLLVVSEISGMDTETAPKAEIPLFYGLRAPPLA
jgi:hypothetical protein